MSISGVFCVLLLAHGSFTEGIKWHMCNDSNASVSTEVNSAMDILSEFRNLVSETYWFPSALIDGIPSVLKFNKNDGRSHMRYLLSKTQRLRSMVNETCRLSDICKHEVDKLNMHRLLELYVHSIPALGHVTHFAELLFEKAHQPMKRAIQKSNHRNADLQAVDQFLLIDWGERFCAAAVEHISFNRCSSNTIANLLCGEKLREIRAARGMEISLKNAVNEIMVPRVVHEAVQKKSSCKWNRDCSYWNVSEKPDTFNCGESEDYVKIVTKWLLLRQEASVRFYQNASRLRRAGIKMQIKKFVAVTWSRCLAFSILKKP